MSHTGTYICKAVDYPPRTDTKISAYLQVYEREYEHLGNSGIVLILVFILQECVKKNFSNYVFENYKYENSLIPIEQANINIKLFPRSERSGGE